MSPTVSFAPNAPGYDVDPYPVLEALRTQAPVSYWTCLLYTSDAADE